jgi:exonuclease SbcC
MKILAIRGKNIASLEGEFELDFTIEPLLSAGIFAITGSTGSGKSTLLDVLCLALFDDTPRISRANENNIAIPDVKDKTINQKDCRTLLRRGSGEGYAEVEFLSLGSEKYCATWSVKRARSKADGSLQNTEMRLVNLSSGEEVPGRKGELLAKISELIGLTFDQFTRAVLLAQGDFATFLKAKQSEKAELLEKLTGTGVYSRISTLIFEKTRNAEQDYLNVKERMQGIELLTDEQTQAFSSEQMKLKGEADLLKKNVNLIADKAKWITDSEDMTAKICQAEQSLLAIQTALAEARPRYDYISRLESVQEIRDVFTEYQHAQKQLEANRTQLIKRTEELENNTKAAQMQIEKLTSWFDAHRIYQEIVPQTDLILTLLANTQTALEQSQTNEEAQKEEEKQLATENVRLHELNAEQERLNHLLPAEIAVLRAKLEEGIPCPVCGSIYHPIDRVANQQSLQEKELNKQKQAVASEIALKTNLIAKRKENITRLATFEESYTRQANEYFLKAGALLSALPLWQEEFKHGLLQNKLRNIAKQWIRNSEEITNANEVLNKKNNLLQGDVNKTIRDIKQWEEQARALQTSINQWLANRSDGLAWQPLAELLSKDDAWIRKEKQALTTLKEQETTGKATLEERRNNLSQHQKATTKPQDEETKDCLQAEQTLLNTRIEQGTKRMVEIEAAFANHQKGMERMKAFEKELAAKSSLSESWKKLNDLLGSATGSKFKEIAQGYTLDALLTYANKHLKELAGRYELQRIPNTLALQVVDLDMLGEIRTVHSLSGGESFLISLALALGLSSLSSNRMRIESLFIDEGFGSLDVDTLRITMDALERLQTQGRKIGVISHVPEMTERIPTQICVQKTANGKSSISIRQL